MAAGNDAVFLVQDGHLIELQRAPYELEDDFQAQLARHPELLGGGHYAASVPRRWLLVTREAPVPDQPDGSGRWSLDHLFVDQDGIPTLVEVKRANDTRLRREVIGQMLDYAANGVRYWPLEVLRHMWEATLPEGVEAVREIQSFAEKDADQFWDEVGDNLRAGRVRMLFVSEEIPIELQTIIEYLNEQMENAEVLGVSIARYEGQGLSVLVPRVVGTTARLQRSKQPRIGGGYEEYLQEGGEAAVDMEARIHTLAEQHNLQTRRTPKALQLRTASGERDILQFYPGFRMVQLTLEPLRTRGHEALVSEIFEEATTIAGRGLTEKYPGIPLEEALQNWDQLQRLVLRIAQAESD